jgi:nucleoside-diphosphate kinase
VRAAKLVQVDRSWPRSTTRSTREAFFGELVEFITSAPTLALVLEGEGAIKVVRTTMGATNPVDAAPERSAATSRWRCPDNLVHGSDSPESAKREIGLWFADSELV